jgi:hypothetical protein
MFHFAQKELARISFVAYASDWPDVSGLSSAFSDANKRNKSTNLALQYHAALRRYLGHLQGRFHNVKPYGQIVKGR